jgi:hypothetical protein
MAEQLGKMALLLLLGNLHYCQLGLPGKKDLQDRIRYKRAQ